MADFLARRDENHPARLLTQDEDEEDDDPMEYEGY